MNRPSSDWGKRLAQLLGEKVEVLLKNDKIIVGELLSIENSMNVAIASNEGLFFIRGDSVVAIKKGGSAP